MVGQFKELLNALEPGSIIRLWKKLYSSSMLQDSMSKYFNLYELSQTMILGFVEDERVFNAL